MLIYLLTSMIIFQLDDSKLNSEEDQNDDSDYNTSKKRKRGKKRTFLKLKYQFKIKGEIFVFKTYSKQSIMNALDLNRKKAQSEGK